MKISNILASFNDGIDKTDFNPYIGDTNYDKASYPMAQLFPENSTYQSDQEYQDTYTIFFVFEKGNVKSNNRRTSEYLDNISIVEDAIDTIQTEVEKNSAVTGWKVDNIDFLVAENSENLLDVIRVDWAVTKFIDLYE